MWLPWLCHLIYTHPACNYKYRPIYNLKESWRRLWWFVQKNIYILPLILRVLHPIHSTGQSEDFFLLSCFSYAWAYHALAFCFKQSWFKFKTSNRDTVAVARNDAGRMRRKCYTNLKYVIYLYTKKYDVIRVILGNPWHNPRRSHDTEMVTKVTVAIVRVLSPQNM